MLSRTANHLYWMARYMERAENMARILDVTSRMCLAPNASKNEARLWIPAIRISGEIDSFRQRYGAASERTVVMHMVFDRKNPSSIFSCLHAARENARAVRGAITTEMWESLNATWLEIKDIDSANLEATGLSDFCERVKSRSHLFRGVTFGTMLHDDAFGFLRLGTFLERADNTARILDVKYHVLLPSPSDVGGAEDYYEWSAILRSVSAFAAYRKIYRETVTAWRVAEILVLRHDMPRSLHACLTRSAVSCRGCARRIIRRACALPASCMRNCILAESKRFFRMACTSFSSISFAATISSAAKSRRISWRCHAPERTPYHRL